MKIQNINITYSHTIPILLILILCNLYSCGQPKTRKDIEKKINGKWTGLRRDISDSKKTSEVAINIKDNNLFLDINNKKSDDTFRIFVHANGDTIMERRAFMNGIIGEPSYLKINFINKKELRLLFVFKYSDQLYLNDKKTGFYLKRVN